MAELSRRLVFRLASRVQGYNHEPNQGKDSRE